MRIKVRGAIKDVAREQNDLRCAKKETQAV